MKKVELKANERLDDLMYQGRHIIQNTQEFCFSLDAVLLAHFMSYKSRQKVLDLGTGTGVMPLLIADAVTRVDAIEISPVMAELAARNVAMNELADKIFVRQGDYRSIRELYQAESFDVVLANPPYRPVAHGQVNKMSGVARARHEFTATLRDVVAAASFINSASSIKITQLVAKTGRLPAFNCISRICSMRIMPADLSRFSGNTS